MRVLVASRNAKKLKELNRVLEAAQVTGIELVGLSDVPDYPETPETGATFADNARIKTADGVAHTGLPTIADDSGIAVDELRGMPGMLSARWSGAHGDDEAKRIAPVVQRAFGGGVVLVHARGHRQRAVAFRLHGLSRHGVSYRMRAETSSQYSELDCGAKVGAKAVFGCGFVWGAAAAVVRA